MRIVAERTGEQTVATTRQTEIASGLPALREAEARAAAALAAAHRRPRRWNAKKPAPGNGLPNSTAASSNSPPTSGANSALAADATAALERLAIEEQRCGRSAGERRAPDRRQRPRRPGGRSARGFRKSIRRSDQRACRSHGPPQSAPNRPDADTNSAPPASSGTCQYRSGLAATGSGAPDLAALGRAVAARRPRSPKRKALRTKPRAPTGRPAKPSRRRAGRSRTPRSGVQRLETEAKTIGKLLAVESKNLWPPVMDALTVEKATRRRWAPRWATISTHRSILPRRCAGPAPISIRPIRRCPKAPPSCRVS